jgi:bifunctional DNase/RNase
MNEPGKPSGGNGNGNPLEDPRMVGVWLGRIVIRDGAEQQYIYLREKGGKRGFPIVIGTSEALEIRRVVHDIRPERPLTHQLAYSSIRALGAELKAVDVTDLRNNTFFARILLLDAHGQVREVDARPSDAVALAMRAGCPIRVAESVLDQVRTDGSGPDPLPDADDEE